MDLFYLQLIVFLISYDADLKRFQILMTVTYFVNYAITVTEINHY